MPSQLRQLQGAAGVEFNEEPHEDLPYGQSTAGFSDPSGKVVRHHPIGGDHGQLTGLDAENFHRRGGRPDLSSWWAPGTFVGAGAMADHHWEDPRVQPTGFADSWASVRPSCGVLIQPVHGSIQFHQGWRDPPMPVGRDRSAPPTWSAGFNRISLSNRWYVRPDSPRSFGSGTALPTVPWAWCSTRWMGWIGVTAHLSTGTKDADLVRALRRTGTEEYPGRNVARAGNLTRPAAMEGPPPPEGVRVELAGPGSSVMRVRRQGCYLRVRLQGVFASRFETGRVVDLTAAGALLPSPPGQEPGERVG